jgi:hypothetical protein
MIATLMKKTKAAKGKGFKLKPGIPLDEQQIKLFVAHYKTYKSFPGSKIPCIMTGKLTTAVGPWLKKKVAEFGSAEALLRGYKCRGATKKPKIISFGKKRKKDEATKVVKEENGRYDIPLINLNKPTRSLNREELAKDSRTICLRPDIFLNNGRHCDSCHYYGLCENRLKNLPKHIHFDGTEFISTEERKTKRK